MIKIDKGIEIPKKKSGGRKPKYPWRNMEIGDSFFLPDKTVKQFTASASRAGREQKRKYLMRSVEGGVRIWRIK